MRGVSTWGSRIFFTCTALSLAGAFFSSSAQSITYSTDIHINEFIPNPVGDDATLEFIELHNNSDSDVDLQGWGIDTGGSAHFIITDTTLLPSHGFLAFFSAEKPISLTNTGDTITLTAPDSQIHDQVSYTTSKEGYSYNRLNEGAYVQSSIATPNAANMLDPTPTPSISPSPSPSSSPAISASPSAAPIYSESVHINEFIPNPAGDDTKLEFIELYNRSDDAVDISGWKLDDIADGGSSAFTIPEGVAIPAHGYVIFYSDQTKISLNNDSEHVRLVLPDGIVLDDMQYGSSKEGYSYNRVDDGDFQQSNHPTPGAENIIELPSPTPTPTPKTTSAPKPKATPAVYDFSSKIVINEIYPNPAKGDKNNEFIEIKNLENRVVSLSGWTLDDEDDGSRPYHFKTGDKISAKKIIVLDKSTTKIALNNSDDTARLIDSHGKVVAILSYQKTSTGQSLSRVDDGSYQWTDISTPGQENIISVHIKPSKSPSPKKSKKSTVSRPRVAGVMGVAEQSSPFPAWPGVDSGKVVQTIYGRVDIPTPYNQKQLAFLFFGLICAGGQLLSGISMKEKIWFG